MSELVCPDCHSPELEELEQVISVQSVRITREKDGSITKSFPVGGDIADGGELIGVQCGACGWELMSADYVCSLVSESTQ